MFWIPDQVRHNKLGTFYEFINIDNMKGLCYQIVSFCSLEVNRQRFRRGTAMKNEDEFFEDGEKLDEELLDFEFDDLPEESFEEISGELSSDEGIIELVDVVEEGEALEDLESDEIALDLDADKFIGEEIGDEVLDSRLAASLEALESDEEPELDLELDDTDLEGLAEVESEDEAVFELEDLAEPDELEEGLEVEIDDITREPTEEPGDALDLETLSETEDTEEDLDFDLEALAEAEASEEEPGEEMEEEETEELPISELQAATETESSTAEEYSVVISEERMEAIFREVVEDVVERVIRETMVGVAEKVIGQAIDALKQSLESPSE